MSVAIYKAIGRRKDSVARVNMVPGKGEIIVNGRPFKDYLCRESLAIVVTQPLDLTDQRNSYDIRVNVKGGGLSGQDSAIRLGIANLKTCQNGKFHGIIPNIIPKGSNLIKLFLDSKLSISGFKNCLPFKK